MTKSQPSISQNWHKEAMSNRDVKLKITKQMAILVNTGKNKEPFTIKYAKTTNY